MNDPTAVRTLTQSGFSGFYLAVDVPGSLSAGQAFGVIAGPRETPLMALFQSTRAKYR
jgi:MOSC domain-containing protein YiiM